MHLPLPRARTRSQELIVLCRFPPVLCCGLIGIWAHWALEAFASLPLLRRQLLESSAEAHSPAGLQVLSRRMLLSSTDAQGVGGRARAAGWHGQCSGCVQDTVLLDVVSAVAGLSWLQGKPWDPLVLLFCPLPQAACCKPCPPSSFGKLSMAGGVIRG